MKKIIKILFIIVFVFILVALIAAFWQRDNITALLNSSKYSSEELKSQIDSERENIKQEVDKYTNSSINDISAEDEAKLFKGEITVEDISEKYHLPLNVMEDDNNHGSTEMNDKDETNPAGSDKSEKLDAVISDGVSRMYALKAKYVSKLGGLERQVINDYNNLPKEKQNAVGKKDVIAKNIGYVADMEQKCDAEVAEVLASLESKIKELNGDAEIVKILREAYESEKKLKKSYYLSLYNN